MSMYPDLDLDRGNRQMIKVGQHLNLIFISMYQHSIEPVGQLSLIYHLIQAPHGEKNSLKSKLFHKDGYILSSLPGTKISHTPNSTRQFYFRSPNTRNYYIFIYYIDSPNGDRCRSAT